MVNRLIPVPYATQVGNDWGWDCGPACDAMIIAYVTGRFYPVAQLAREAGVPKAGGTGTSPTNLRDQLAKYGVFSQVRTLDTPTLHQYVNEGQAVICLVKYRALYPDAKERYDKAFDGNHFVVATGVRDDVLLVHDPLWPDQTQGAYHPILDVNMDNALRLSANPRQVVIIHQEPIMDWIEGLKLQLERTPPESTVRIELTQTFMGIAQSLQEALGVKYQPPAPVPTKAMIVVNGPLVVRLSPAGGDTGVRLATGDKITVQGELTVPGSAYLWTKIVADTAQYCAIQSLDGVKVFLEPANPT